MTQFLFTNNASTTLASSLTSIATTLTVVSGSGAKFPNPGSGQQFALTLIEASNPNLFEIVYCTARSTDTLTIVRAQEGTTATAFNAGDLANHYVTAATLGTFSQPPYGGLINTQYFQSAGTFTYTKTAGTNSVVVEVWAAGGGGGACNGGTNSCGSSGAAGGYARKRITSGFSGVTVTVGAGGAGGVAAVSNGGAGGSSSFGGLCGATGGTGGYNNATGFAYPGIGSGGDLNLEGGAAGSFWGRDSGALTAAAPGNAPFMPAGQPGSGTGNGAPASNPGCGGGAAVTATGGSYNGGAGAAGLVIVWEYS